MQDGQVCVADLLTCHDDDLASQVGDVRNIELGLGRKGLS